MSRPDRWRLFVAVPISDELRTALTAAVDEWRRRPDLEGLRWIDPGAWHLTLLFIGSTDPARAAAIGEVLEAVAARHEPMELATGGVGGFGSAARARVAWYGVADHEHRLARLASEVRSALAPDEPPRFRAHVTMARARSAPVDLRRWITEARAPDDRLDVAELRLMRSHLGRGPARYETVSAVRLGTRIHA